VTAGALDAAGDRRVTIVIDGRSVEVAAGISVAAALLENGVRSFRRSVSGEERAPLCGMGVCYECRVTISGIAHRRACLVLVSDGLEISTAASDT
jgi:predicted molibdopterin-dependent oxidoreductase YjgC